MKNVAFSAFVALFTFLASPISQASEPRIISAGSTVTELIFALGAEDQLVGVDLTSRHYLTKDKKTPILGYHRQLTAESLLSLSPTHLLGSPEMGPDSTLKLLNSAGVKVQALPDGNSLEDFNQRIDVLSAITNSSARGEQIKADVAASIHTLETLAPTQKPKIIYMMINDGRPLTVAGNGTTVNTIIKLAGGVNPVADKTSSYKQLSIESIVDMQPDYILMSQRTLDQLGGMDSVLKQQPLLAATPAVKNNKIIPTPGHAILGGFGLTSLQFAQDLNAKLNQTL